MNHDLNSDEVAIVNEAIRSLLILTDGPDAERRAVLVTHAAAQIVGVTMAVGSYPDRTVDSARLDQFTDRYFSAVKDRRYIHAMAERVSGPHPVDEVLGRMIGPPRGDGAVRRIGAMP